MYDLLIEGDVIKWSLIEIYYLIIASHIVEHPSKEEGVSLINKLKQFSQGPIFVSCHEGDTRADLDEEDAPVDDHISV
jgi:hypothetical protein